MGALQLAKIIETKNFNEEQWFRDASSIISKYQVEEKLQEQREWQATRNKYLDSLKQDLDQLKKNIQDYRKINQKIPTTIV